MDVRVRGPASPAPFLSARDLLETEHDLDRPVEVRVRESPDERTWTAHDDERHVLNISRQAATSAMARPLALHEYAHMVRNEEGHVSHVQSTDEALFLALSGHSVERRKVAHCYQIANHMKDIYADDVTLSVGPPDRLVAFLESRLAAGVADRPNPPRSGAQPASVGADPELTAVHAAFGLAIVERHGLVDDDHRIYDLAHAAAKDAPAVPLNRFKRSFRELAPDPGAREYKQALVDLTQTYATGSAQAAD
ncbi:hypothetical protein L593_09830 [Salinarchaeum sp. Harcht-Bsk1]|uniref:DUF5781 family protein n=1 Tax=Salinarchaeum sp. Harcht-Bsk1 TaxID=1333523 RepID=UPI00034247D8|nr:DUF5781 family protein [Salinarchaeum sp. Harcht-Bsk1]AGN01911.1 hypothetical protein L593_09830 [Salinarchaeum sp. Harcht-Bsk1]